MKKVVSLLMVLVLGGIAAWYFYSRQEADSHPSVLPAESEPVTDAPPPASYPVAPPVVEEAVLAEPLPSLANSDQSLIEVLSELFGAETLEGHFVLEQVINRFVATIDSLDSRQVAPLVLPVQPLPGEFQVLGEEALVSSPQNTSRYEPLVQTLSSAEPEKLVAVYRRFYPLFQESYQSLGHGDVYFNDRLVEIVDHLLMTPQLPADAELVKMEAQYQYADPELEGLSAGQKMLLRSGPENAAVIREKLKRLRAELTRR